MIKPHMRLASQKPAVAFSNSFFLVHGLYDSSSEIDYSTITLSFTEVVTNWLSKTVTFAHMDEVDFMYALMI